MTYEAGLDILPEQPPESQIARLRRAVDVAARSIAGAERSRLARRTRPR